MENGKKKKPVDENFKKRMKLYIAHLRTSLCRQKTELLLNEKIRVLAKKEGELLRAEIALTTEAIGLAKKDSK